VRGAPTHLAPHLPLGKKGVMIGETVETTGAMIGTVGEMIVGTEAVGAAAGVEALVGVEGVVVAEVEAAVVVVVVVVMMPTEVSIPATTFTSLVSLPVLTRANLKLCFPNAARFRKLLSCTTLILASRAGLGSLQWRHLQELMRPLLP